MTDAYGQHDAEFCLEILKVNARDFYLADLLLPQSCRAAITAIHAFHVEISNIALSVGEPIAAQMRMQWWVDVVSGQRPQEAAGHLVARSLLQLMQRHNLPPEPFIAKLDAHVFDLYHDPMGDRTMFEGYCGETRSCLFQWAGLLADIEPGFDLSNASGHSGVATGTVHVLENMAHRHNQGKVHVPEDLLAAAGMTGDQFLASPGKQHKIVVLGLVDLAREHTKNALESIAVLPVTGQPVFKPLALVPLYLKRIERDPLAVFAPRPPLSQIRCQWALWRF
jgi:phytoene synthase